MIRWEENQKDTKDRKALMPSAWSYAMSKLATAGVEFYSLSEEQMAECTNAGRDQRSEGDKFKVEYPTSMNAFAQVEKAAGTQGKSFVYDA